MDYDFDLLDLTDESDEALARRRGWFDAVQRGFHEGRPEDGTINRFVDLYRSDEVICRGAWLLDGKFGAGPIPVATYASYDKTINAGLDVIGLRMITDVTTSPAHRRRGLLRRMIEDDLADAVSRGIPVAALTAAEATIYGRWGFGPATFRQGIEVDTGPRFELRSFEDTGRVELIEPLDAWPHVKSIFDRFHAQQRGSVEWPAQYEVIHTGLQDFPSGEVDRKLRCAVHLDASDHPDGFVLYTHDEKVLKVREMIALDPAAQLGLWAFLGSVDGVWTVTHALAHPEDPLIWALHDLNRVKVTEVAEFLWLRVLDVERALGARPWAADGQIVLAIDDPQGYAAGSFAIETSSGRAQISRTDRRADVSVTAETLASLYLGAASVAVLHSAGRVSGSDDLVARFSAMADLNVAPYCLTGF